MTIVNKTWLLCDVCRVTSAPAESGRLARDAAHHDGWRVGHTRGLADLCPPCYRQYQRTRDRVRAANG